MNKKEIIYLPIKTTEDIFTIGACGKYKSEKKELSKTEATYLYVELHKWLFSEELESIRKNDTANN